MDFGEASKLDVAKKNLSKACGICLEESDRIIENAFRAFAIPSKTNELTKKLVEEAEKMAKNLSLPDAFLKALNDPDMALHGLDTPALMLKSVINKAIKENKSGKEIATILNEKAKAEGKEDPCNKDYGFDTGLFNLYISKEEVESLKKAGQLGAMARNNLKEALRARRDIEKAEENIKEYIKKNPQDVNTKIAGAAPILKGTIVESFQESKLGAIRELMSPIDMKRSDHIQRANKIVEILDRDLEGEQKPIANKDIKTCQTRLAVLGCHSGQKYQLNLIKKELLKEKSKLSNIKKACKGRHSISSDAILALLKDAK
jgi:hypothetical protein